MVLVDLVERGVEEDELLGDRNQVAMPLPRLRCLARTAAADEPKDAPVLVEWRPVGQVHSRLDPQHLRLMAEDPERVPQGPGSENAVVGGSAEGDRFPVYQPADLVKRSIRSFSPERT